jgi:hypothetical protein
MISATFAVDYALWGLDAGGYHLTNLALQIAATVLAYFLLRELTLGRVPAFLGALVVGLHPGMVSAVPVLARRHDSVAAVALFGSFLLLCRVLRSGQVTRPWLAWAGSLLLLAAALFAKESAFAALALVPATVFVVWRLRASDRGRRLADYVRVTAPYLAVAAGVFALRLVVLGGLGGHRDKTYDTFDWEGYRLMLEHYVTFLFWPFHHLYPERTIGWLAVLAVLAPLVGALVVALPHRYRLLVGLGGAWMLAFGLLWIAVRHFSGAWYLYYPLLGAGLIVGSLVEAAPRLLAARGSLLTSSAAAVMLAGVTVYGLGLARTSALVESYPQWQAAGKIVDGYLAGAAECTRDLPSGTTLTFWNAPKTFDDGTAQSELLNVTLFEYFTFTSYLRLLYPDREFDVYIGSSVVMDSLPADWAVECGWGGPNRRRVVATSRSLPEPDFPPPG